MTRRTSTRASPASETRVIAASAGVVIYWGRLDMRADAAGKPPTDTQDGAGVKDAMDNVGWISTFQPGRSDR